MTKLVLVSPSYHCDVVWRRPPAEQVAIRQRQYDAALDMLARLPEFCFEFDQATLVREYLDANPHRLEQMRQFVREGRLEITGGEETIPDNNLVSGEGLVRNVLLGRLWFEETLGATATVANFDDSFGQMWQLPQVISQFGYTSYRDTRTPGLDPKTAAPGVEWEGLDGSRIFYLPTHASLTEFTHICNLPVVYSPQERLEASLQEACALDLPVVFVRYTSEEDFVEQRIVDKVLGFVPPPGGEVRFGLCGEIMREARQANRKAKVVRGELNPTLDATHITRIGLKQAYRQAEWATRVAETAATWAALSGAKYPAKAFLELWRKLAYVQFHDSICGCHTDAVNRKVMGLAARVKKGAERLANAALPKAEGQAFTLFNPLPFAHTEPLTLDLPPGLLPADGDGQALPAQITQEGTKVVATLEALGMTAYPLVKGKPERPKRLPAGKPVLTGKYEVTATDEGAAVRHLAMKRTVLEGAIPEVGFRHENGDLWNESYLGPLYTEAAGERKLVLVEAGPVFTRFVWRGLIEGDSAAEPMPPVWDQKRDGRQVVFADLRRLEWEKEVIFYRDLDRLEVRVDMDFHGRNTEVSLSFPLPLDLKAARALYDIPFAAVERKPYFELPSDSPELPGAPLHQAKLGGHGHYPALDWVAYQDGKWGMALANEGTPAHRLMNGRIEVLVLRSPTTIASDFAPPAGAYDNGHHQFCFALQPYRGNVFDSGAYRLGQQFNARSLAALGADAASRSLLQIQAPGIVLSCLKPAERGEGYILRTYETAGEAVEGAIQTTLPVAAAWETDLMERPLRQVDLARLKWRPYEIKTLRVTFA